MTGSACGVLRDYQAHIVEMSSIHLGTFETAAGLTFVCLSRAKRFVDLLVDLFPR